MIVILYYIIHTRNNMIRNLDNDLLNLILTSKNIYNKFDMKKYILVNKQFNYICKNYIIWIYMKDLNIMNYIKKTYPDSKCYMVRQYNINNIDLYSFKDLDILNISYSNITDISMLEKLHTLDISGCYKITDVSMLRNLHTLIMCYCNITDVSMLGNLHTLDISHCKNIKDVSMFGNLHTLNISCCKQITNVSMLGNLHTLDISNCEITDVSMLGKLHILDISWCKITDISMLGNLHTLKIRGCKITDVSMLGNVIIYK